MRMNTLELRLARIRKGYTQTDLGKKLNLSLVSYGFKERGKVKFNVEEVLTIIKELDLNFSQMNTIFFDNKLTEVIRNDN